MRSMDETLAAPWQQSEWEAILAAETAEAHVLAQRAAAPEIGQQGWRAAEEVAVQHIPGEEMPTAQQTHRHSGKAAVASGLGGVPGADAPPYSGQTVHDLPGR
jgi:hypothetical protein